MASGDAPGLAVFMVCIVVLPFIKTPVLRQGGCGLLRDPGSLGQMLGQILNREVIVQEAGRELTSEPIFQVARKEYCLRRVQTVTVEGCPDVYLLGRDFEQFGQM